MESCFDVSLDNLTSRLVNCVLEHLLEGKAQFLNFVLALLDHAAKSLLKRSSAWLAIVHLSQASILPLDVICIGTEVVADMLEVGFA